MTLKQPLFMLIVAALALVAVGAEAANPTKAQICEAFKNTAAGTKALCLAIEYAQQALGKPPNFAKCESRFMSAFAKAEQLSGECVTLHYRQWMVGPARYGSSYIVDRVIREKQDGDK